jgi:chromosome partitioning protein
MGVELGIDAPTAFEWLCKDCLYTEVAQRIAPNLAIIPGKITFAEFEVLMQQKMNREQILARAIRKIEGYDYVIIDSPPSLGLITINILTAANIAIIPLKLETLSYEGARQLLKTIATVKEETNPGLKISGFLATMVDRRRNFADIMEMLEELAASAGTNIFKSHVRNASVLADLPSYGKSIFDYKANSPAAADYNAFVQEFLAKEDTKNGN